jgi:hypothetical protein
MIVYRIDNRSYNISDVIYPQNLYQCELSTKKLKIEEILESKKIFNKPSRNKILMVFQKIEDAEKHWLKQIDSKFYELQIEDINILHKGDYNKIEELYKSRDNEITCHKIAEDYWNEILTDNPIVEIFVPFGIVTKIICNSEHERIAVLKKSWDFRKYYGRVSAVLCSISSWNRK